MCVCNPDIYTLLQKKNHHNPKGNSYGNINAYMSKKSRRVHTYIWMRERVCLSFTYVLPPIFAFSFITNIQLFSTGLSTAYT